MPRFNLDEYVPVQERILEFWKDHPTGRILTLLASDPNDWKTCRYRAEVYADREDSLPVASGYAFEVAGGQSANMASHEENCETSAIGRALANLGYATSHKQRPSREEMQKVERMAEEQGIAPAPAPRPRPQAVPPITDAPYPSVARQHGIKTMVDVLDYLVPNGFNVPSGRKADAIADLEQTFGAKITPAHGKTETDGSPTIYPGDIYDFAFHHISQQPEHEA